MNIHLVPEPLQLQEHEGSRIVRVAVFTNNFVPTPHYFDIIHR